ncbi:CTL-like protein 2 [Gryllus bimaculatus]|nr:CTL-like protein 2 [Gryllus bimaculatus]
MSFAAEKLLLALVAHKPLRLNPITSSEVWWRPEVQHLHKECDFVLDKASMIPGAAVTCLDHLMRGIMKGDHNMACCSRDSSDELPHRKPRGCTDILWLLLFIAFLFLLIFIASFAFVYGNPLRLLNGYDTFGNTCGTSKNEKIGNLSLSGLDTIDKSFLFYLDIKDVRKTMKLCVKKCPDHNLNTFNDIEKFYKDTGSKLCRYDFNFNEVRDKRLSEQDIANTITLPLGPCPPLPVYLSDPVLHRCIPKPVKELSSQVINSLYDVLNSWDALEQILADLYASWKEILALSFLSFVLSLIMVAILHMLASVVAWIFMLIVSIAAVIILLLVIVMRKRIRFLAALFEDSASCLGDIPALFIQPLITFIALLAFFAFWISVIVCLATSTYPGVKPLHPYLDFQQVTETQTNARSAQLNISLKDFKKFTFVEFVDPAWVRYFWWVYLIGLIWVSEFILACQQMVIAGAVSMWYFNRRSASGIFPVCSSTNKLICYHMGSVAKGSMLITLFKVPRLILTYIYVKLKNGPEDNCCVRCGLRCCICCFYCFENFIKYMNHNAYTVIAMEGHSFCTATKIAFTTLGNNALRLITLNSVGDFILFLGKCFVTAVTGSVGLLFLKQDPHLHFYAIPTLVVCIFAFFIAHCVLSLYEIVIDTMFICVCEDERLNPNGGEWSNSRVLKAQRSEEGAELTPINTRDRS